MVDAVHDLQLGGLNLIGRMPQGSGYRIITQGDEAGWGNPVSVTRVIKGLLQDGARVALDSWDNREAFLRVTVEAETAQGLAEGEAALMGELGKRNTLIWEPPQGFGPPTVFEVVWSEMDHEFADVEELLGRRTYGIRLTCAPFARSVEETVAQAVIGADDPPEETVLDDGSSADGWTATRGGEPVSLSGSPQVLTIPDETNEIVNPRMWRDIDTWVASDSSVMDVRWADWSSTSSQPNALRMDNLSGDGRDYLTTTYSIPVTAGENVTLVYDARNNHSSDSAARMTVEIRWYDSNGGQVDAYRVTRNLGIYYQTRTITTTVPAGVAQARIWFRQWANQPQASHYITRIGFFRGTTSEEFFDGDTSADGTYGYTWEGTPHRSRSIRVPVGPVELNRVFDEPPGPGYIFVDLAPIDPQYRDTVQLIAHTETALGEPWDITLNRAAAGAFTNHYQVAFTSNLALAQEFTVRIGSSGTAVPVIAQVKEMRLSTSVKQAFATTRQQLGTLPVGGSARTQGSLEVDTSYGYLGTTLLYTYPDDGDGYSPPLSTSWHQGGVATVDPTTVSGIPRELDGSGSNNLMRFRVPIKTVRPGAYAVVARLRGSLDRPARFRSHVVGGFPVDTLEIADADVGSSWGVHQLGVMHLPPRRFTNPTDTVFVDLRVDIPDPVDTQTLEVDEIWLFDLERGSLTWVDVLSERFLWIDAPSIDSPTPQIWVGSNRNRGNAYASPNVRSWGRHEFPPGDLSVFAVTTKAPGPRVALRYHRRWHTHAVE